MLFEVLPTIQNLLAPVHPHVIVHKAGMFHLQHAGVPIGIMGCSRFELTTAVDVITLVLLMLGKRLVGPAWNARIGVIIGCIIGKVHSQLASHDELFEIGVLGSLE